MLLISGAAAGRIFYLTTYQPKPELDAVKVQKAFTAIGKAIYDLDDRLKKLEPTPTATPVVKIPTGAPTTTTENK